MAAFIQQSFQQALQDPELLLESAGSFPPAGVYQKARNGAGMATTVLASKDIQSDYKRLTARGVVFRGEPQDYGPSTLVMFEDTCGNLINLAQFMGRPA